MGWMGWDWKSLKALILRAPLCGANKHIATLLLEVFDLVLNQCVKLQKTR